MAAPLSAPPMCAALSMRPPETFMKTPNATTNPSQRAIACVNGLRQPPMRQ
jgi:hypothetical protein